MPAPEPIQAQVSLEARAAGNQPLVRSMLVTDYVLFFPSLESRAHRSCRRHSHPVDDIFGSLRQCRNVLHDRDAKFCASFDDVLASEGYPGV
jgi:hypothetical protein